MANPIPDEDKKIERIHKEKIKIDSDIQELLEHHIRNDLNCISLGIGQYLFVPKEIMQEAQDLITRRYKEAGLPGDPPVPLMQTHKEVLKRCKLIANLLEKLFYYEEK